MLVYLGLGSNVGDREEYLRRALASIGQLRKSIVRRTSSIYETEAWGKKEQARFLNQVVEVDTQLDPHALLTACQKIEESLERRAGERWGPRTIDIDLLLCDDVVIDDGALRVPHSRLAERRFVLVPLVELSPSFSVPGLGKTVEEILEDCPDKGGVKLYLNHG